MHELTAERLAELRSCLERNDPDPVDVHVPRKIVRLAHAAVEDAMGPGMADRCCFTTAPMRHPDGTKIGRNESCPCGSGKKFKRCCGNKR